MNKNQISDAVWQYYSREIKDAVSSYIKDNCIRLGISFSKISTLDEVKLAHLSLDRVNTADTHENIFQFDVIAIAHIEICRKSLCQITDNAAEIWLQVFCEIDISLGASNFTIKSIEPYDHVENKKPGTLTDGSHGGNQTFSVPIMDAFVLYTFSPDLRRVVDSGDFVYIDGHYCINAPKYTMRNERGVLELTEYAASHTYECCLSFKQSINPYVAFVTWVLSLTGLTPFHSAAPITTTGFNYNYTDQNKEVETRAAAMRAELSDVKDAAAIMERLPGSFSKSFIMLMEWRKVTVEQLAEKSLLSPKTIQRMRSIPDRKWNIEVVIAVCVGLQLPPYISFTLIEKAGLKIRSEAKDFIYAHLLTTCYQSSISVFNEYLEAVGLPPLSGKE